MNRANLLCRNFAACYAQFRGLDAESRAAAERLVVAATNPQASKVERDAAVADLARRLFPAGVNRQPVAESFGERVESIMRQRGLSNRDLANSLGMNEAAVYVMLARRCHRPWRRSVKRVADAFGMTAAELWPFDSVV